MSLTIEIDSNTIRRIPFHLMRERLRALGQRFTERDLEQIPYVELRLAALANSGDSACPMELVVAEKQNRRKRFMDMTEIERDAWTPYLQQEGMYHDLRVREQTAHAPAWNRLSIAVQLWCVLNCLHNHSDAPAERIERASSLVEKAAWKGVLNQHVALRWRLELDRLRWSFPYLDGEESFRYAVGTLAEEVMSIMDTDELNICQAEQVRDYSCTSDCYHPMVAS